MARRSIGKVEWLDEGFIGGTAYRENGRVYVDVSLYGSVMLNGKEYIIEDRVTTEVHPCTIPEVKRGA